MLVLVFAPSAAWLLWFVSKQSATLFDFLLFVEWKGGKEVDKEHCWTGQKTKRGERGWVVSLFGFFLARKKCNTSYWESPVAGCGACVEGRRGARWCCCSRVFGAHLPCKEHVWAQSGQSPQCFAELHSQGFLDVSKFGGLLLGQEHVLFLLHKMRVWD